MKNLYIFDLTNNKVCHEDHHESLVKGVIYEHRGSCRRIAVIDPSGCSSTSDIKPVGYWHPTGHKLNIVGVTFPGNSKTYSYFCSSEYSILAGDSITIDAPLGMKTVQVEFVRPFQGQPTLATKLLPIVCNTTKYYNFEVKFIDDCKGLSKPYYYSSLEHKLPDELKVQTCNRIKYIYLQENDELVCIKFESITDTPKYGLKTFKPIPYQISDSVNRKLEKHGIEDKEQAIAAFKSRGIFKASFDKRAFIEELEKNIYNKVPTTIKKEKENKTMGMNMNKIFGNMEFGKVNTNAIKYSVAGLAFRGNDGNYLTYDLDKMEATNIGDMVFDFDSIFVMPAATKDIQRGDIIKHQSIYVIVKNKNEDNTIAAINPITATEVTIIPVKNVFGFNYVSKVVNMFAGMAPDGDNPFGDMNKMFPMMMLAGEENDMFTTLAMMNMFNGNTEGMDFMNNPMFMYAMMKGKF